MAKTTNSGSGDRDTLHVGIIGTGNIAPAYIKGCGDYKIIKVVACADVEQHRAAAFAEQYGLKAMTVDQLLADKDIDIVI
ncbi:MAG TPA: Gfo/Idh/MocA family oxidoreductase, partial [Phototrophicaceae bacterium]|nr:Gfo/Idh/MocA family oxidoreductase [Phototrophicaceae bacterium]